MREEEGRVGGEKKCIVARPNSGCLKRLIKTQNACVHSKAVKSDLQSAFVPE